MLPGVIFVKVLESLDISDRRSLVVYEIRVRILGGLEIGRAHV